MDLLTAIVFCILGLIIVGLMVAIIAISKPHKICLICGEQIDPWDKAEYPHGNIVVHAACREASKR